MPFSVRAQTRMAGGRGGTAQSGKKVVFASQTGSQSHPIMSGVPSTHKEERGHAMTS